MHFREEGRKSTHKHLIYQEQVTAVKENTAIKQGIEVAWDTIIDRLVTKSSLEDLSMSSELIDSSTHVKEKSSSYEAL